MDRSVVTSSSCLAQDLARSLPAGLSIISYHVSCPPTKCASLFTTAPNSRPAPTYCESHLLSVAIKIQKSNDIDDPEQAILTFAVEVLVYSTASLTTIFVSKADSTGYLHLLRVPPGAPSPLKTIATTFLSCLVRYRKRPGIKLLLSLFARSQDQYLFPGSIENKGKHLLDDRGLIRWWCRVLDPVLNSAGWEDVGEMDNEDISGSHPAKAYLLVPGLDKLEMLNLLSPSIRSDPLYRERWTVGHPLYKLSQPPTAPPRCLIPRFPDDPKARFVEELDEELPEVVQGEISTPSKRVHAGRWKSVKSLEQFWDAMEFRQECSSGRLVGFMWILFEPSEVATENAKHPRTGSDTSLPMRNHDPKIQDLSSAEDQQGSIESSTWTRKDRDNETGEDNASEHGTTRQPARKSSRTKKRYLSGPIMPRQPRVKKAEQSSSSLAQAKDDSPHYIWPQESRGQVMVNARDYKRISDFLLRLDFANEDIARSSTSRWIQEVRTIAGLGANDPWGEVVTGQKPWEESVAAGSAAVNTLAAGSIRRKRKENVDPTDAAIAAVGAEPPMHVLSAGLVRKKPKSEKSG